MLNSNVLPVGAGYVRAIFSARARGFAAPVDLLRGVLRVASRLAVRARVAASFAGYLVTDAPGPVVWRDSDPGRVVLTGGDCYTARDFVGGLRVEFRNIWGAALDAPAWLPGGAVRRYEFDDGAGVCAAVSCVVRGGVLDAPGPVFSERRGGYAPGVDLYCCTSEGQVFGLGLHGWGWHNGALDAPDCLAAGSCLSCSDGGAGIGAVVLRGRL